MTRLASEQFSAFGDDLAPGFDIEISGKDAGGATELYDAIRPLVVSVTFEDDEEMSSMFELQLVNQPDTGPGRPVDWRAVIDSKAFQEGNYIDLWMGYGSDRHYIDRAEIVKWLPDFPEEGARTFKIKGYDGRHHMFIGNKRASTKKKRKTFYRNMSDEDIVRKIAEKYGMGYEVYTSHSRKRAVKKQVTDPKTKKTTTVHQHVYQTRIQTSEMSDWAFLQKLAAINRFDLWVDFEGRTGQWVVHFQKREDTGAPGYLFEYRGPEGGGTLLSATPEFNVTDQPTSIEVLDIERGKRAVHTTKLTEQKSAEDLKLTGQKVGKAWAMKAKKEIAIGSWVRFSAFGQVFEAFSEKPFKNRKEAESFADNWIRERERDLVVIEGKTIGLPSMRARQFHELRGMGARLDGLYRFTNVKQVMQPGQLYICNFTAHKVPPESVNRSAPYTSSVQ